MTLVKNGRVQGFAWEPGRNAGYRAGRCLMWANTRHITAGACGGDRSVGLRGIFPGYAPKSASCGPGRTQFGEIDAVHFHNCEWNQEHTGLEVEKRNMTEVMNAYQLDSCGLWVAACTEYGIPMLDLRIDGPGRYPIGARLSGHVDHQDLQHRACDMHSDGWPLLEWQAVVKIATGYLGGETGGGTEVPDTYIAKDKEDGTLIWVPKGNTLTQDESTLLKFLGVPIVDQDKVVARALSAKVNAELAKAVVAALPPGSGGTGTGVTKADIDEALRPFRTLLPGE